MLSGSRRARAKDTSWCPPLVMLSAARLANAAVPRVLNVQAVSTA